MCLAIVNYDKVIEEDIFINADEANSDGMGMSWVNNKGVLWWAKQMADAKDFHRKYAAIRTGTGENDAMPGSAILIHFRYATHGIKNRDNCHPFFVSNKLGFVHNGVFSNMPSDKKRSDTQMFNELILKKLPKNFLNSEGMMELLKHYCEGSKVAFLDDKGKSTIINMEDGVFDDDTWYSNKSGFLGYNYWASKTTRVSDWDYTGSADLVLVTGPGGKMTVWKGETIEEAIARRFVDVEKATEYLVYPGESASEAMFRLEEEAEEKWLEIWDKQHSKGITVPANATSKEIVKAIGNGLTDGYGRPLVPGSVPSALQVALPRSTPQEAVECHYGCD